MKRLLCVFLICAATAVFAQEKNPVTSAVKEMLPRQAKNIVAAAEEMPADKYAYKPTEQQMPFGDLVLHILGTNNTLCSKIGEIPEPKPPVPLKESDGKDKLVAGLKASFDFCTSALDKVDDAKLADPVELFGGHKGTRAAALIILASSWSDHYGAEAMYLRLSGLLPPTAKPKK
ncbi:MAG TPA: DinB family protein [Candidatus Sulfotelmatobacter sp.]|nr:DinB family protein [Candidatus Sulfotelmatobacter sp.]